MFRRNNTYTLNNPLKLHQKYSHVPLQYRNNANIPHITNDKTLSIEVDNSERYDNFEEILPCSEKDNENIVDNDNDYAENDGNNEDYDGNNVDNNYDDNNNVDYDNDYDEDDDEDNDGNNRNEEDDDYYNEEDDNNIEGTSNDDMNSDEQHNFTERIVDEAMDTSELPNGTSEFLPYFNNATEFLLFCWIQKHNICKKSYYFFLFTKYLNLLYIQYLDFSSN